MNANKSVTATFTKTSDPPPTGGNRFDGNYRGTYSAVISVPGYGDIPVSNIPLAFRVSNGAITGTEPAGSAAGGSVNNNTGAASFGDGICTFTGTFVLSGSAASASGGWGCPTLPPNLGRGTWKVTRQ
jgi:hypothetical protein